MQSCKFIFFDEKSERAGIKATVLSFLANSTLVVIKRPQYKKVYTKKSSLLVWVCMDVCREESDELKQQLVSSCRYSFGTRCR